MSSLVGELESIVGPADCLHRSEELLVYECDGLTLHPAKPFAVVLPHSREEVCSIVSICRAHGVPFVPRGAGTGLSGGAIANDGAVIIECSRMNRILEVSVEDRYAIVEPGVVNADLSKVVLEHGLFYAPDPSSQLACTIGGNVAENAGGPHTLKYGTTTHHVLALELVLPDASVVHLGSRTGFAPGYDLVGAVVGSEGTLGIVTQVTVRLEPIPERVETLLASFPDVVTACRAASGIIEAGAHSCGARNHRPAHDCGRRGQRLCRGASGRRRSCAHHRTRWRSGVAASSAGTRKADQRARGSCAGGGGFGRV